MVDTIKFSQMPNAGNINNNDIMPSLRTGENVILNNPWTFLPSGNTASRPAPSSTINYRLRFNTDEQLYEYYDAVLGAWTQLQESEFTQGPFLIYTADSSIPDGQNLGALADGILKQTITSGIATLDIAVNGTDYYGPGFTGLITAPVGIADLTGHPVLGFNYIGSAVSYFIMQNGTTGNNIALYPQSSDTNVGITFDTKGNKSFIFATPTTSTVILLNPNSGTNNFTGGFAIPTITANRTYTFQDASGTVAFLSDVSGDVTSAQGTANQVLVNGTSGSPETGAIVLTLPQSIGTTSTPTFGAVTLTNGVLDSTAATIFTFTSAPTSVNYLSAQAQITGVGPILQSLGSDTNINISYQTKATGAHRFLSTNSTPISIFSGTAYQHQTNFVFANTSNSVTVTWPDSSGTVAYTSQIPTGAALTKTDDTNVTLSLGGSPSTALVNAASLTLGWTGTLSGTRGGTGVNNGASTITIAANVSFSGAFAFTGTLTGITGITFPTSGTLATTSQLPTPAALTKTDDTNVTLTLGGTPSTALLQATSLTLGWTGQLGLTRGGTGSSLTASNGGIFYSTASATAILAGTATAQQLLLSGASTIPQWSTSTYPLTNAVNTLLYASSANVMAALSTANYGVLVTSSSGVPSISSGGQIPGTRTNDAGSTGNIGEYIYAQNTSGQALSTGTPANVTSISLTAGDWDITGCLVANAGGTTTVSYFLGSASITSATLDPNFNYEFTAGFGLTVTGANPAGAIPTIRVSLSTTTTVYLVAQSGFGISTMSATGFIAGRRAR